MIQRHLILWALCFLTLGTYGQDADSTQCGEAGSVTVIETLPEFPGGLERMIQIMADSMIYPETALIDRLGGQVVTQFIVDTMGQLVDIQIAQGSREDLDKEAIRLVGLLKNWRPGIQAGVKVKVLYRLPIIFYPDDKWRKKYKKRQQKMTQKGVHQQ